MQSEEHVQCSEVMRYYGANGRMLGYQIEMWHTGINEHKVLKDKDRSLLDSKVSAQLIKWDEKWQRLKKRASAQQATEDAARQLREAQSLLQQSLEFDHKVNWDTLKISHQFIYCPREEGFTQFSGSSNQPVGFTELPLPKEPRLSDPHIGPRTSFLHRLLPPLRRKEQREAQARLQSEHKQWQHYKEAIEAENARRRNEYESHKSEYAKELQAHEERQRGYNASIDELRQEYHQYNPCAVEKYATLILGGSPYPCWIDVNFSVAYNTNSKTIVVDRDLPTPDRIPMLKEMRYIASRDECTEKHITDKQKQVLYDSVVYQIALRTIYELYQSDGIGAIHQVTFNGWVEAIDSSTGRSKRKCIASVQAIKNEFEDIELSKVDPKACFKRFKGVAATTLIELAPVTPILQYNRDDERFIESREIAGGLDADFNLAPMDWEDFEHLIRELFEAHFKHDGGDVRVTKASRDGGVDAVAFDPDPIRGGKIVLQAKRYTNTVGLGAVRDLYGTVVNEGATKGILITTSDYGPDAYNFAKDKPLTLLSGNNLLHLLEKHGYKAKIDIEEAKRLTQEE